MRHKRQVRAFAGLAGLALAAAACGGQSGSGGGSGASLTIDNASGTNWTCNYNPFNPNANVDTNLIYEPLYVINDLNSTKTPWLATSYAWGNGNKTLTMTIRKNVEWTDGKPFTAADVAYNFNLEKQHPELDAYALWTGGLLDKVFAQGDKVTFEFKRVSTTALRYIMSTRIKPEHVWSKVADPAKASTKQAVGTGPYKIQSCSAQSIIYTSNPSFWKGKPPVARIVYPAFTDNGPANTFLAQGKADWGGQFVPDIEHYWQQKDPKHRKFWYPAVSNVAITVNMTKPMLEDKRVRQALVFAIDKNKVSQKGMYGYQKPASQTGVVDSMKDPWLDSTEEAKYGYTYDCAKAGALLTQAGFKKDSKGMYAQPDGKPFQPELIVNSGFTDWVGAVKIIGESMKSCGIDVQTAPIAGQQFDTRRQSGAFDLAYDSMGSGDTPYYELRNFLYSKLTQPIGKTTDTNHGRYSNPKVDALIEAYDKTTDKAEQVKDVKGIEHYMLDDVPVIPTTQNVSWAQFDTTRFTGWPSESDPYANPAPYNANWEVVLLRLKPVK